jgi:hypothetical protein
MDAGRRCAGAYVGLVVCSVTDTLNTSTFDNVTVR